MSPKMEKVMALVNKAEKDYKASQILLNDKERDDHCDVICFHCQQCVEKSLKTFLMLREVRFPFTHDLDVLQKLCKNLDDGFNAFSFSSFSGFGVEIRYDAPSPDMQETEEAFETAGVVLDYVKKILANAGGRSNG